MFFIVTVKAGVEDAVGVTVVGNNDVFIATGSTDREADSVISVQLFDVSFPKMNIFV